MALSSFLAATTNSHDQHHQKKKKKEQPQPLPPTKASPQFSWEQFKSLLSCRSSTVPSQVHDPSKMASNSKRYEKMSSTCGSSICALRDVVHGNTRVVHRSDTDQNSFSSRSGDSETLATSETAPFTRAVGRHGEQRAAPAPRGGMPLRRLSGCYECHAVDAEPASRRYPRPRTLSACSECGEIFPKPDSLELHQTLRHAVSELGPEDSGRNIVEIIFKSSWQKRDHPICQIERILKVHNTPRTIARFEDYRTSVKSRAAASLMQATNASARHGNPKKNPRCAADGNELLRFHCTSLACPLGARGSAALCSHSSSATPICGVCGIIRHGFPRGTPVRTTASSGRAHDRWGASVGGPAQAMLVCRVIAGRVRRAGENEDGAGEDEGGACAYDSVAGEEGPYGNLEELFVANPRAILPCFVVIYRVVE